MMHDSAATPDVELKDHGSLFELRPITRDGELWVEDNVAADAMKWAGATVVEHRYASDILDGMLASGLTVRFKNLILTGEVA